MDEAGAGIVTHATAAEREGSVSQSQGIDSRDANINGVSLLVQAVHRNARGTGAEKFIAPIGAIAADDFDLPVSMTDCGGEVGKNVEDARIIALHLAGSMIPKKMGELFFGFRNIKTAPTVNDVDAFAGVSMIQAEMVFLTGSINRDGVVIAVYGSDKQDQG
jgi:hypothetical protein